MGNVGFTVEQVRSFVAVAEHEHVSRAAESLHLTQGAVTQQIHNFERALGLHLLERDGRGVRLTDAGRALAITCRAALRGLEVVDDSARALRMLSSGSLHVGASPTCASYYLPARLAMFARHYPDVSLNVTVEPSADINNQVVAGALDCALIEGPPLPEVLSIVVDHDELVLVTRADHPLARLAAPTSADLARYRYLGRGPAWAAEKDVREMLGQVYDHSEVMNLGHPEYIRAAVIVGLGYAVLPLLAVQGDLDARVLQRLPVRPGRRAISAIRRRSLGGPALEAFWQFVIAGSGPQPEPAHPGGSGPATG